MTIVIYHVKQQQNAKHHYCHTCVLLTTVITITFEIQYAQF